MTPDRFLARYQRVCALGALAVFLLAPCQAEAGQPRLMTKYGNWDTYIVYEGDNNKACYMASRAQTPDIGDKKRGDAYAVITHRPGDSTRDVFSYIAGYPYKPGSEVQIDIDGQRFVLFTQADTAWAPDADTDGKLAKAIRAGTTMVVKGTSSRGTKTVDTLSLAGSSAAYDAIGKECR